MALTDENGGIPATMLVSPSGMGGYSAYQGNEFGGAGWWIILLIILFAGGWNNGNGFGGNGTGNLYPWMNQAEITTGGFQNQMLNDNVTSIRDGISGISAQMCNSFADMAQTVTGGFANAETAANARQMANMNQAFAAQTAMAQGFNQLGSQFANCCCENRLASADLKYTIATENCADRYEAAQNTRDIIENCNRNNQAVLDKLCQLELDGKNDRIADLERQLTMANLAASQTAQTGRILADNAAQTVALEQYLNPAPIPAYVVQNPNCCTNACGCGSF